jgi:hypothetical protein
MTTAHIQRHVSFKLAAVCPSATTHHTTAAPSHATHRQLHTICSRAQLSAAAGHITCHFLVSHMQHSCSPSFSVQGTHATQQLHMVTRCTSGAAAAAAGLSHDLDAHSALARPIKLHKHNRLQHRASSSSSTRQAAAAAARSSSTGQAGSSSSSGTGCKGRSTKTGSSAAHGRHSAVSCAQVQLLRGSLPNEQCLYSSSSGRRDADGAWTANNAPAATAQ